MDTTRSGIGGGQVVVDSAHRNISAQFTQPIGYKKATPDVIAWIVAHPAVAAALVWEDASGPKSFADWTQAQKAQLIVSFARAWAGGATGLVDPPPNTLTLADLDTPDTVFAESAAWPLYRELVAWSLAMELSGLVPWTITQYDNQSLALLFDSRQTFPYDASKGGWRMNYDQGMCVPAPPDVVIAFLAGQRLIDYDPLTTIVLTIEWARGFQHFYGYLDRTGDMYSQWQYRGHPPLSRMLSGTPYLVKDDGIKHRTAGCHGTAGFFHQLLRVVNIPANKLTFAAHAIVEFPVQQVYLSHGDDPYDIWPSIDPVTPTADLLLDKATFDQWFANAPFAQQQANVPRRPKDLSIKNLSNALLRAYCHDEREGLTHENGDVARMFQPTYSVFMLEQMQLWLRAGEKIAILGGCAKVPQA